MKKLSTIMVLVLLACPVFGQLSSWTLPVGVTIIGSNKDKVAWSDVEPSPLHRRYR